MKTLLVVCLLIFVLIDSNIFGDFLCVGWIMGELGRLLIYEASRDCLVSFIFVA